MRLFCLPHVSNMLMMGGLNELAGTWVTKSWLHVSPQRHQAYSAIVSFVRGIVRT